jgi:hypothetical protein
MFRVVHQVEQDRLPELISLLAQHGFAAPQVEPVTPERKDTTMPVAPPVELASWEFLHSRDGETYQWPELLEEYRRFDVYRGRTQAGTIDFAIGECNRTKVWGKDRKYYIVFHVTSGFKRPLVEFLEPDDYEDTGELIAIIRGSDGRRKMYDPAADLPEAYDDFRIETYRDRIDFPGSWTKLSVVVSEDDTTAMLNHALIQGQSRFGIAPY